MLLGTRFVATRESMAPEFYKKNLLEREADATIVTDAFTGQWARALRNTFAVEYRASGAPTLPSLLQSSAAQDIFAAAVKRQDGEHFPMYSRPVGRPRPQRPRRRRGRGDDRPRSPRRAGSLRKRIDASAYRHVRGAWGARSEAPHFKEDRTVKLDVGMLTHDLKSIPDYARKVEALGFDCLWSSETQHDPFLPLAVAATVTEQIKLGTAIAVAFPRSPMITAHIAWDIQKASNGRLLLGLGSQVKGHNERRFSVKFESPGPKLREIVLALRAIWDCWQNGTKLNFKGQFYRFDLMTPFFNPGPDRAPEDPRHDLGRERVHVPRGGRGVRRPARASVQQPEVPARVRAPVGRRGHARSRAAGARTSRTRRRRFVVVGDTEEELAKNTQSR